MGDIELIQTIGIMIVAAAAFVLLLLRANVPSIVVYILAGLLLGPMLGIITIPPVDAADAHAGHGAIHTITEIGIALLLFIVGLELSLERIRDVGKVAVLAGIGQVVFTAIFGFVLSVLLQFSVMESIFLATALTFSSTVVVVKLLDQKKELSSLYGRIAVGIFLVQDLVVIVALTFLAGLGGEESMNVSAMAWSLGKAFAGMGLLLVIALIASRYVIVRPFEWAARSPEMLLIWSLCWCFGFVVAAEIMGLSPEIGAFLAGVSLAQLECSHDLRRRVHPLMNFFLAIFFIALGAQMQVGAAVDHWKAAVVLSLFVLLGNPLIFMWIIARCGYSERTSFLTSVTVAQISEFSFVFAAMGLSTGLIDQSILSLVTVIGLATIAISSYMILYNHWLYRTARALGLLRIFRATRIDDERTEPPLRNHIVIVGMNSLGRQLARLLHKQDKTVLAIDIDARKLAGLPCRTLLGNVDYPAVFEDAFVADARLVISALHIEDTNQLLAYRCHLLGVPAAIHAFDSSVVDDLRQLGVDYLIESKAIGNVRLAIELESCGVVRT